MSCKDKFKIHSFEPVPFQRVLPEFDVQFFRWEEREQGSSAHASSVARKTSAVLQGGPANFTLDAALNASSNSMLTSDKYDIDGTIVTMANATHKEGDIIEPCILNPNKAVNGAISAASNKRRRQDRHRC